MPVAKTIMLFTIDELSDPAKEKARDWFRQNDTFSDVVDHGDFLTICDAMGIDVRQIKTGEPDIRWSGFSSQGDGASYFGTFDATGKAGAAIREHAPTDTVLHGIADKLDELATKYPGLSARITPNDSRYVHSNTMSIESELNGEWIDGDADEALATPLRALADWRYRDLEREYDDHTSDETVDENIRINEYTFREDGRRENA